MWFSETELEDKAVPVPRGVSRAGKRKPAREGGEERTGQREEAETRSRREGRAWRTNLGKEEEEAYP